MMNAGFIALLVITKATTSFPAGRTDSNHTPHQLCDGPATVGGMAETVNKPLTTRRHGRGRRDGRSSAATPRVAGLAAAINSYYSGRNSRGFVSACFSKDVEKTWPNSWPGRE